MTVLCSHCFVSYSNHTATPLTHLFNHYPLGDWVTVLFSHCFVSYSYHIATPKFPQSLSIGRLSASSFHFILLIMCEIPFISWDDMHGIPYMIIEAFFLFLYFTMCALWSVDWSVCSDNERERFVFIEVSKKCASWNRILTDFTKMFYTKCRTTPVALRVTRLFYLYPLSLPPMFYTKV